MRRLRFLLLLILIESCMAGKSCVTKNKCRKLGTKIGVMAGCQPKGQECDGKRVSGKKYCKDYKGCDCCVPPIDCSEGTLRPCEVLNGTCISQNDVCDGHEVTDKTFCKSSKSCKCCFPNIPCPCKNNICEAEYQNQTYNGICRLEECLITETRTDKCSNSNCNCCINVTRCSEDEGFFRINGSSQCFKLFQGHNQYDSWEHGKSICLANGLQLAEPLDVIAIPLREYLVPLDNGLIWLGARGDGSQFRWESDNDPINNLNPLWYPEHPFKLGVATNRCLMINARSNWYQYPYQPYFGNGCYANYWSALCEMVRK